MRLYAFTDADALKTKIKSSAVEKLYKFTSLKEN